MKLKERIKYYLLNNMTNKQMARRERIAQGQINMIVASLGDTRVDMVESEVEENGVKVQKLKSGYAFGAEPGTNRY